MFNETVVETISMLSGHLTLEDKAITLCQKVVKQTSSDSAQYPSFLYICICVCVCVCMYVHTHIHY